MLAMASLATPLLALLSLIPLTLSKQEAEVSGMFVFGSSLVDNGNNNFLKNATTRANFHPYGIDFPLGPSGRFSNGRNAIDVLGELLKLPRLIPPFTDPRTKGARVIHGVNFASGGSGILDQTGSFRGGVMSLNQQIRDFKVTTLPQLRAQLRCVHNPRLFGDHLSNYLFVVGTGGNDYLQYFVSKDKVTVPVFTESLISTLSHQLKQLYDFGARKFVVFSVQAMGCYPVVREAMQASNGSCVEAINEAALLCNSHLKSLARSSNDQMPGSKMVFVDSYKIIRDIIDNPVDNGFSDTSKPCCEVSTPAEGGNGVLCKRNGRACENRRGHVYFDGLHPTEAVNVRIAHKAYDGSDNEEAYPTNVKKLARL